MRFLPFQATKYPAETSTSILRVSTSREEWSSVVGNTSGFGVPNLKMIRTDDPLIISQIQVLHCRELKYPIYGKMIVWICSDAHRNSSPSQAFHYQKLKIKNTFCTQEVQADQTACPLIGSGILNPWIILKTIRLVWSTGLPGCMLQSQPVAPAPHRR